MVARHEMPGKPTPNDPSWRDGLIRVRRASRICLSGWSVSNPIHLQIIPSLRDGALFYAFSRHFMPGYDHILPSGHFRLLFLLEH
jgi:hypothetical protein